MMAGVQSIQIAIEQKAQNYMATHINNLEYDTSLEVRYWQHPADIAIIHEVENGTIYTTKVCTCGSKTEENFGAAGIIFVNGKLVHQLNFNPYPANVENIVSS